MEHKNRILIMGDYIEASYHPLEAIKEELSSILSLEYDLEYEEHYMSLEYSQLSEYNVIISYTDCWDREVDKSFAAALITYVVNGGSLLILHNGISLQKSYELAQIMGAKFISHPERTVMKYTDFLNEHPIMEGVSEFELLEEPYQFEYDYFSEKTILFYYVYAGIKYAAAWSMTYGLGRIIYLSPGHDMIIFQDENYQKIIKNSMKWLTKK